jgi:CubicO group peptidase (beta-lactamase class C family)
MKYIFSLVIVFIICLSVGAQTNSFISDSLDGYIQKGLKDWELPGLAIVIVKDGKVVVMKGYGVRDLKSGQPIDQNTLFMIASNSKLFTGTILANLETQGRLSLNDKVTKYFPGYKLYDPATTAQLTIRDLLTHRIGTKTFQGDFTFWNSELSRKEIMKRMQLLKPVGIFRQDYGYCNSCFMTAGEIIPKITGLTWEKYVQDSMLTPLQMSRSTAVSKGMETKDNVASPYTTSYSDQLVRVPFDQWDNLGPAASIISSVNDLSHWLLFQLDSGKYNGKQVMPFAVLQKTRDVNIMISSRKNKLLPIHFRGYGLGLVAADYNGRQIYWHTGGAGGMLSNVCFVPEERLGIAILSNNDNQSFFEVLRLQVLDAYLGVPYVNRSEQLLPEFLEERKEQLMQIEQWRGRVEGAKPALQLSSYVGAYNNSLYGSMSVMQKEGGLQMRFNSHKDLTAQLKYMDNDQWLMEFDNILYGIFAVKFRIENQKVKSVDIKVNEFVEEDSYTFVKK